MSSYPSRVLGSAKVHVSASDFQFSHQVLIVVGFGGMGLSFAYGPRKSEEENFKVLSRAADLGVTFWDTADVYGFGHNEGIVKVYDAY
jgi:aryl-alcohol dehydrogenase-like predicted oxidoreductase